MALNRNEVILVNREDVETGTAEKMAAHLNGQLHRAVSVFITNDSGEMLLQRRAGEKYHSGGLWSNACCSHPCPGEHNSDAAVRRLGEELGFSTRLQQIGTWYYRAEVGNGLIEHELDHLFTGTWSGDPAPDPAEVSETKWVRIDELLAEIATYPERFSAWFPQILSVWMSLHPQAA